MKTLKVRSITGSTERNVCCRRLVIFMWQGENRGAARRSTVLRQHYGVKRLSYLGRVSCAAPGRGLHQTRGENFGIHSLGQVFNLERKRESSTHRNEGHFSPGAGRRNRTQGEWRQLPNIQKLVFVTWKTVVQERERTVVRDGQHESFFNLIKCLTWKKWAKFPFTTGRKSAYIFWKIFVSELYVSRGIIIFLGPKTLPFVLNFFMTAGGVSPPLLPGPARPSLALRSLKYRMSKLFTHSFRASSTICNTASEAISASVSPFFFYTCSTSSFLTIICYH